MAAAARTTRPRATRSTAWWRVQTIRLLDLQRPVVIGSSIGGVFATELGLRHPELVGGVIPVDSPAYWPAQGMDLEAITTRIREDRAGFLAG